MKTLSKNEKIKQFQEHFFHSTERHHAAVYLNAIRTNNQGIMDYYEGYGNSLYKILLNVRTHEKNIECGFSEVDEYNEYGWVKDGKLIQTKEIDLGNHNSVTAHVAPNGKWVYGINCSTSHSGRYGGGSIWCEKYESEKEALIAGLTEMIEWHQKHITSYKNEKDEYDEETKTVVKVNWKESFCRKIINKAYKEMQQLKTPQLALFE
jgi:hypothetical protein